MSNSRIIISAVEGDGERELARAVFLEIKERGIDCEISDNDGKVRIFIFRNLNEDNVSIIENSISSTRICSYIDADTTVPDCISVFRRPFIIKRLCDTAIKSLTEAKADEQDLLTDGDCVIYNGEKIPLTKKEFELFSLLLQRRGECVSREYIANTVFEGSDTNVTDVYIRYLRKKLDLHFDKRLIVTVRNKGYMLKDYDLQNQ